MNSKSQNHAPTTSSQDAGQQVSMILLDFEFVLMLSGNVLLWRISFSCCILGCFGWLVGCYNIRLLVISIWLND